MVLYIQSKERYQLRNFSCQIFSQIKVVRISLTAVGLFTSIALLTSPAWAQQVMPAADGVGTVVTPEGDRFDITGGTTSGDGTNLFHSFEDFSLSADQTASFQANPAIQNILGRINGGNASVIDGLLQVANSDANLFLLNPNGILFGPNAQLDLAGALTATTATRIGFDDNWFNAFGSNNYELLTGTPDAFAFDVSEPGAIINAGTLTLGDNQSLMLLGGTVVNLGTLSTPGGDVTIAAVPGESVVRLSYGNGLLNLDLQTVEGTNSPTTQLPETFSPLSIPELLREGTIESATGVEVEADGTVRLTASDAVVPTGPGVAIASGELDVAGNVGGAVAVVGDRVGLVDASVDASGVTDGGTVRIGGDYQGEGALPNATVTYVGADVAIDASAELSGDAGQVIIWADGITAFAGRVFAQGGETSGNGGFVEVSGRDDLLFRGDVDLSAPNGRAGSLLLDPENIVIVDGNGGNDDGQILDGVISANDVGVEETFTISENALEALALTNANITLSATNNITIGDLTDNELNLSGTAPDFATNRSITFQAGGNFQMQPEDTISAINEVTITGDILTIGNIELLPNLVVDEDGITSKEGSLLFLQGREIDFEGEITRSNELDSFPGNGIERIRIYPDNVNQPIFIGGLNDNTSDNTLDISINDINAIKDGFTGTQIGFLPATSNGLPVENIITIGNGLPLTFNEGFEFWTGSMIEILSSLNVSSGLTFVGREINIRNPITALDGEGFNGLSFEPGARDQDILLGGVTNNDDDSFLDITENELEFIGSGFDRVNFGRSSGFANSTGDIIFVEGNENLAINDFNLQLRTGRINDDGQADGVVRINRDLEVERISVEAIDIEIGADLTTNSSFFYDNPNTIDDQDTLLIDEGLDRFIPITVIDDSSLNVDQDAAISASVKAGSDALSLALRSNNNLTFEGSVGPELGNNFSLDIELIADADQDGNGVLSLIDALVNTNDGTFTGEGVDVELNGSTLINTGSGDITFQPSDAASSIGLGNGAPGDFNLNTTELTTNLESSGTLTVGSPDFTGTGEVTLTNLLSIGSPPDSADTEDYNLTVRGGIIQFGTGGFEPTAIVQLPDNKTAQFIATDVIRDGNFIDVRVDGADGAILLDTANGFVDEDNDPVTDGIDISARQVAARTRNSGNIEITLAGQEEFVITSVGDVDGIQAAPNSDIVIGFFDDLPGDLDGETPIRVEQPIQTSGSGVIRIGPRNLTDPITPDDGTIDTAEIIVASDIITEQGDITLIANSGVSVEANSSVTSSRIISQEGGNITLNADFDNNGFGLINIFNSDIDTNGGDFSAVGRLGDEVESIQIFNSTIRTEAGDISLDGNRSLGIDESNGSTRGIEIQDGSIIETTSGSISLTGVAGSIADEDSHHGVIINGASQVTTVEGDIAISGTGGDGIENSHGVVIQEPETLINSSLGDISITAVGGADANVDVGSGGLVLFAGEIVSDAGIVSITGEGKNANGTPNGPGIEIGSNSILGGEESFFNSLGVGLGISGEAPGDITFLNDITFDNPVEIEGNVSGISANGNIAFNNDVTIEVQNLSAIPININATGGIDVNANISSSQDSNITLNAGSGIVITNDITADGGEISLNADFDEDGVGNIDISNADIATSSDIKVTTNQLNVENGGSIVTFTEGSEQGGDVRIAADQINLANGGRIDVFTARSGPSGNLIIENDQPLTLRGEALTIRAEGDGSGAAGDIRVTAPVLILDGVELSAASGSIQGGGNISLNINGLVEMRNGSFINAESTNPNGGRGGSVFINTGILRARPDDNNDIVANAVGGNGGLVEIEAIDILNFTERSGFTTAQLRSNQTNDLSASSEMAFDGEIIIDVIDRQPEELPSELVDPANLIARGCNAEDAAIADTSLGDFIITGRGGRSLDPTDIAGDNSPLDDLGPDIVQPEPSVLGPESAFSHNPQPAPLAEAHRAVVTESGEVLLLGNGFWRLSIACASLRQL